MLSNKEYINAIQQHIQVFQKTDKPVLDKLWRYYQGKFHTAETGESEADLLTTSVNLIFAIVETGLSSLVSPNPQVTTLARNASDESLVKGAEALVNLSLDACDFRDEQEMMVFDGILGGRGVVKTTWDADADLPVVTSCDIRSVFFDLTARRPKDIRYWVEVVPLSQREFNNRVEQGIYKIHEAYKDRSPDVYPKWLVPQNSGTGRDALRDFQKWWTVYEVYDIEESRILHFLPDCDEPLMQDKLVYNPYDILNLNYNGEDCRGLSEIGLISPNQEEINHLLTYWLNIVAACVPGFLYDPAGVDEEDLAKAQKMPIGGMAPVRTKGGKTLGDSISDKPQPNVPAGALGLLDKVTQNVSIVSALADAQRGQVTGARTATELALIEGQLRNRLASRQRRVDRVTTSIAEKFLFLLQKYGRTEKMIQLMGQEDWTQMHPATVRDIKVKFKVVPYSPMESNRAVQQEQFKDLLQYLTSHPGVDQFTLLKAVVEIFDSPALRKYNIVLPRPPVAPPAPVETGPGIGASADPAATGAQVSESSAAMPSATQQAIADAAAQSPATTSPLMPPPGPPVGMPQLVP